MLKRTLALIPFPEYGSFKILLIVALIWPNIPDLNAQSGPVDDDKNTLVRITSNPKVPVLGGAQLPPYLNMATFLNNAFISPDDGMQLFQDSSVCSVGEVGTNAFEPYLHANYEYANDRVSEIEFWQIENDERTRYSRKQFAYEQGQISGYQYDLWNAVNEEWQPDTRERISYNGASRQDSSIQQIWTGSEWSNSNLHTIEYNAENRPVESKYAIWSNGQWERLRRSVATYNANARPMEVLHQINDGGNWITTGRETYAYDPGVEFILESYLLEQRDSVSGQLAPVSREEYHYNLRGFYTFRVIQHWNDSTASWDNMFRDRFEYTPRGVWTTWRRATWDGDWQNTLVRDFNYADGLQVDIEQVWDADSSKLVNNRRRFLKFDDYGNLVWERNFEHWNPNGGDWVNGPATQQCRHFWSEKTTSTTWIAYENQIDCRYMNPYLLSSEIQCMSLDPNTQYRARIFDQMGRMVYQQAFFGGATFSVETNVATGLYYMMVSDSEQMLYKGKVIINN